jgi:hypothetical protein
MKTAMSLCVSVAFALALSAQTKSGNPATTRARQPPAGTPIGPHRLGETFNEWLAIEKIELDAACHDQQQTFIAEQPSSPPPPDVDFSRDDYVQMLRAKAIWEDDKRAKEHEAYVKNIDEEERHRQATMLCKYLGEIRDTGEGDYQAANNNVDTWTFSNHRVVEKQSVYSATIADKELGFLKEAYGPATSVTRTPQQNAFGAKWNDILVTWHLPGTIIFMKALGGPKDDLIITFILKAYADRPVTREPNPYLSNKP